MVLDRSLAVIGHYPSIDAVASISRVASRVTSKEQKRLATILRSVLSARRQAQDLLDVGAYVAGSNPYVDAAVEHGDAIDAFLRQSMDDVTPSDKSWDMLRGIVDMMGVGS